MFGLGAMEIGLILVAALIFLGPQKLPEVAKTIGKTMRDLQRAANDFTREINNPAVNYPSPDAEIAGQEAYSPQDDMDEDDPVDDPYHAIAMEEEALAQAENEEDSPSSDEITEEGVEEPERDVATNDAPTSEPDDEAIQKT